MTSSNVRMKVRNAKAEKASLHPPPPKKRGLKKKNTNQSNLGSIEHNK
jgi:hypothetical protein